MQAARSFEVERPQFAIFLTQKVCRLAITPSPSGRVNVGDYLGHAHTIIQHPAPRYSPTAGEHLLQRSPNNAFHDQIKATVCAKAGDDSRKRGDNSRR